ncbi:MAG: NUDIX domain-containing protein [Patescibacteria group bacterium]|nr:NUDIX domain-containing protein [Patescibacteria group bacterium]MDE2438460.1 NUDIX domain-containing protein [Patescibacteria group bacterium]
MLNSGFLKKERYKKVYEVAPIFCVDLVVVCGNEFLLGKRTHDPEKGKWFLPGGRIYKMESFDQAVKRKVKEELNIRVPKKDFEFLMLGSVISEQAPFGNGPFHAVIGVYKVHVRNKNRVQADAQHSEFAWFSSIDQKWHPYVKGALYKAGFK